MESLPTRALVGDHFPSTTPLMCGAMGDIPSVKAGFESVKDAIANGRKTTKLKTPTDSLSLLLRGVQNDGVPPALISAV